MYPSSNCLLKDAKTLKTTSEKNNGTKTRTLFLWVCFGDCKCSNILPMITQGCRNAIDHSSTNINSHYVRNAK